MTVRLYDQDAMLWHFQANVTGCEEKNGQYLVTLDQTAFFPEGGGQGADHGTLNEVRVLDCHETNGEVVHMTEAPLAIGTKVEGQLDGVRRLDMMQQHSGEHIFSGLVCSLFGYDNVGFHIGTEAVTMDFNGPLTEEDIRRVEQMANAIIWKNLPIVTTVPSDEERANMQYRSKKELHGAVRIVQIPEADICACCGTHVQRTGSIGQIKVLGFAKYKSGVRVSILCGRRALEAENVFLGQLKDSSAALSCKQSEVGEAVTRLLAERDALRFRQEQMGLQMFDLLAKAETGEVRVVLCDVLNTGAVRKAAGKLAEGARMGMVLVPKGEGFSFALSSAVEDIRPLTKVLCETFGGKGGGPKDMTQGVLMRGTVEAIREVLQA